MTDDGSHVSRARDAFVARRWSDALEGFEAAEAEGSLAPEDLERVATAAHLVGAERRSIDAWGQAYRGHLDGGAIGRAVRCAFKVGMALITAGDEAQGGGWLARGHRLLPAVPDDAPEHVLMRFPTGLQLLFAGQPADAIEHFRDVAEVGDRTGEVTMAALARLGHGQALLDLGEVQQGLALLDEAMVAVTAGEVDPIESGIIYCAVIEACHDIHDLDRAREWTAALTRWCDDQPDLVPFRGQCLVHRSQVLQFGGDWPAAVAEADRAAAELSAPTPQPALGAARYQQGEMHRLAGEEHFAEQAFRDAVARGHAPHPGLALLRLQQGRTEDAWTAIGRELDERSTQSARCVVLPAYVSIAVAAGQVDDARRGADELESIAAESDSAMLHALAGHAIGAVHVADDRPKQALPALRRAVATWQALDVPYEAARTRIEIGRACADLGDTDTAAIEWDAARRAFEDLGALPDLAVVEELLGHEKGERGGLTGREVEVLGLVATGMTNREIAEELVISEKTVARHLSNIFTKIDVSSRAAATAYAIKHGLA